METAKSKRRTRRSEAPEAPAGEQTSVETADEQTPKTSKKGKADEVKEKGTPEAKQPESTTPEETKQPEETKVAAPPAEACEVWGKENAFDANSRSCKKCPVAAECETNTKAVKAAKVEAKAKTSDPNRPRTPRVAGNGEFSKFGHCRANSQAGIIEKALEEPKTMAELEKETGCSTSRIKSHINWLTSKHADVCKKVVKDGKISFELVEQKAA